MPYSQNSVKNRIHSKFLDAKSFLYLALLGQWAAIIFLGFVKRGKTKNSIPLAKPEYTGCTQQVTRNSQGGRPPPRFHSPKYWLLSASTNNQHQSMPESHLGFMIVYIEKPNTILALIRRHLWYVGLCGISKTGFIWWQK